MGINQTLYEKRGVRCFYKITPEQHKRVQRICHGIENNLHGHGIEFFTNFCRVHPEYTKYFTSEPRRTLNVDAKTSAIFRLILEAMTYLILDYYNKIKKFDKLIGYVAMLHKDMELTQKDFNNFMNSFLGYLVETNPILMDPESQKVLKKYLYCIEDEIASRMEEYREFDKLCLDQQLSQSFCGNILSPSKAIFGHSLIYWRNRKKLWNERTIQWTKSTESSSLSKAALSSEKRKLNKEETTSKITDDFSTENELSLQSSNLQQLNVSDEARKKSTNRKSSSSELKEFEKSKIKSTARERRREMRKLTILKNN